MPASPSLLIVPARFKTGKLYTQIATTSAGVVLASSGDFNVTRATTATRFNSAGFIESVASGVPRLDYYTSGGTAGCPALLVEASGSNLALQSENFTTTWGQTNLNITSGFTSPSNNNSGTLIEATANTARIRQTFAAGLTSGVTSTFSLFAKLGTQSSGVTLVFQEGTGTNYSSGVCQSFRLDTGAVGTSGTVGAGFTFIRSGIENYGNGWYRCSLTVQLSYTPSSANLTIRPTSVVTANLPSTASGDTCYIFGAQLETGSIATSYIPTTTTSGTRDAEVISVTGAVSGCIGQTEGTIYLETDALVSGASDLFCFARATANTVSISKNSSNIIQTAVYTSGPSTALTIAASGTVSGNLKIAVAYKTGESALYINGVQIGTSPTAFSFTAALTQININPTGFFEGNGNQRISALSLYTTRLTNAELAALTTL
jgi:hypothetical protein